VFQVDDQIIEPATGRDFDEVGPEMIGRQNPDDDVAPADAFHEFTSRLHVSPYLPRRHRGHGEEI